VASSDSTSPYRVRYSPIAYVIFAVMGAYIVFSIIETPNPYRWVIVGLAGAFIAVMWFLMHTARRDIREAYRWARKHGWSIRAGGMPPWPRVFTRFPFTLLKGGTVSLEATGSWRGLPAESFLVRAASKEGNREFYVTRIKMKTTLPPIEFHPRSNHGRVLDVGSDLIFESASFNARWRIMAADLVYAHAVVHPRLMERLLAAGDAEVPITIDGASVYTWSTSMKDVHTSLERSLDLLVDVAGSIPPHVLREYGSEGESFGKGSVPSSSSGRANAVVFTARKRDRNHLARLSVALAATIGFSPAAVIVGHKALRAVKRGEANNPRTARVGLILGYIFSPLVIAGMIAAAIEGNTGVP